MEFGISPPSSSEVSPHHALNHDEFARERGFSGNGRRDGLLPGMVREGSGGLLFGGRREGAGCEGVLVAAPPPRGDLELSRNI